MLRGVFVRNKFYVILCTLCVYVVRNCLPPSPPNPGNLLPTTLTCIIGDIVLKDGEASSFNHDLLALRAIGV